MYPSTILTGQRATPSNSKSSLISIGSHLYAFTTLYGSPNEKIALFKSIDGGSTWVEQDAAHEPLTTNPASSPTTFVRANAYLYTTLIRCIYIDNNNTLRVVDYDTTTDLWGSPSIAGPTVTIITSSYSASIAMSSCLRSTGEVIVDFWDTPETIGGLNYTRVSRTRFLSGSWPTTQPFTGQSGNTVCYVPASVVADSTDRTSSLIHSWSTIFNFSSIVSLVQVTYSPTNTFLTTQTINTPIFGGINALHATVFTDGFQLTHQCAQIVYNDGVEKFGLVTVVLDTIATLKFPKTQFGYAPVGDTPVWTFEDVISITSNATYFGYTNGINEFSLVYLSNSMYLFWTFGSDTLYRSVVLCSTRTSGAWSPQLFLWSPLWPYVLGFVNATAVGSNIGVMACSGDVSGHEPSNALEIAEYSLFVAPVSPVISNFYNIAY